MSLGRRKAPRGRYQHRSVVRTCGTPRIDVRPGDVRGLRLRPARTPQTSPTARSRPTSPGRRPLPALTPQPLRNADSRRSNAQNVGRARGRPHWTPGSHTRAGLVVAGLAVGLALIASLAAAAVHTREGSDVSHQNRQPPRTDPHPSSSFSVAPFTHSAASRGRWITVFGAPQLDEPWMRLETRNPFGQRTPLLVSGATDQAGRGWLRVLLPTRPNGSSGWVLADDVDLRRERQRIEVDLSRRRLVLFDRGRVVLRAPVGIGGPQTPTPTGTYFAWARVPQDRSEGPYGRYALGLSGWSRASTAGSGGRLAIHGTSNTGDLGSAVSAGCLRLPNEDTRILQEVPLGTPVFVHR
jgi:L,D-transpeptidase catalytic domain